jgi:haloalkane dehalogenase
MAFHDIGCGDPIVFLHGNPTSSFLWRNIIPHVQSFGRCVAPDLIGMGDSEKLPNSNANSYTFVENRRYLDGFFDALGLRERVTLVVHDWGSALGFDWAKRNPSAVKGIVHMEAIVATMSWEDIPAPVQLRFRGVRSEEGEKLVLQQNIFIEQSIVKGTLRPFTDGDQLEGVCKALRRAVKFRSKLPVIFAIRLDPPVHAGHVLRVSADKEFALQIGQSHSMSGRKPAKK